MATVDRCDWLYVDDHVKALTPSERRVGQTYNVGVKPRTD